MANPFLSSEEYDERAHRMYDNGDYEGALETLKEGIQLYPHSVELYVGLGYTRLAREEYQRSTPRMKAIYDAYAVGLER